MSISGKSFGIKKSYPVFVYLLLYSGCTPMLHPSTGVSIYSLYSLQLSWEAGAGTLAFDGEFPPAQQPPLEGTIAQRRSVRGEDDEGERLRNRALVQSREARGRTGVRMGMIEHPWRPRHAVIDDRLEAPPRGRGLVWQSNVTFGVEPGVMTRTRQKPPRLLGMGSGHVILDGTTCFG